MAWLRPARAAEGPWSEPDRFSAARHERERLIRVAGREAFQNGWDGVSPFTAGTFTDDVWLDGFEAARVEALEAK